MTLTGSPTPNPTTPWRHRAPVLTLLAAFMALAVAAPALAADMQVVSVPTMLGPKSFLEISNTIELGDWSKFAKIMRRSPEISGVLLSSNGGSADDGLAIAKQVFEQKLDAMVTDTCHSICTVIFLAGNERYLNSGANLTVHSAYKQIADWIIRDDNTNAKVSWFIGRMGYPLALAQLWQDTDSSDATPITVEMNTQLKLGFTVIH